MFHNPIEEEYFYDHDTGNVIIKRTQEVDPVLEANHILRSEFSGFNQFLNPVANVPLGLIEKWMNEEKLNFYDAEHNEYLLKRLNSNEYQDLRCIPGKI